MALIVLNMHYPVKFQTVTQAVGQIFAREKKNSTLQEGTTNLFLIKGITMGCTHNMMNYCL